MRLSIPALERGQLLGKGVLTALLYLVPLSMVHACGDLSLPTTHFEGVSEKGEVSHCEQLGTLDLGDIKVLVTLGFQTYLPYSSPELGAGWILPLLDASIVQKDENNFDMVQPDGWKATFWRDASNPSILHGSNLGLAEINGDIITVNSTCGSGWKMIFDHGKIISLCKGNHTLTIIRDPQGRATDLRDGPTRVLALEQDQGTGLAKSITMGDKKYEFSYDAKPRVARVNGVNLVGGVDQSLHKITFADGKSETFDFAVTEKLLPNLKITDAQGKERMIVWGTDGKILQDGEWVYTIKPQEDPEARFASIERKNAEGKSEFWNKDEAKGEEVTQGIDGTKNIKTWFTSGTLKNLVRESRFERNDLKILTKYSYNDKRKPIRTAVEKNGVQSYLIKECYDNGGRLVKKEESNGIQILFQYRDDGTLIKKNAQVTFEPKIKEALQEKENILLKKFSQATTALTRGKKASALANFYIYEMHDYSEARRIIPNIRNPEVAATIEIASVENDPALMEKEKAEVLLKDISQFQNSKTMILATVNQLELEADKKIDYQKQHNEHQN